MNQSSRCKVFSGDSVWPSPRIWDLVNQVTGGAVVKFVPRASSCYHGPTSNRTDCESLTSQWTNSYFQYVPSYNASGTDSTGAVFKIGTCRQAYEIYKADKLDHIENSKRFKSYLTPILAKQIIIQLKSIMAANFPPVKWTFHYIER